MSKVIAQAIMSLDGYIAKQDNSIGRLFDWLQNGEAELSDPAGKMTIHQLRKAPSTGAGGCRRSVR